MDRYHRHIILSEIGQIGQDKLNRSKVLVVGAGGLGCPILQYLTAAGVGTIGIMDFDVVDVSNLQRQVLYGTSSLGMNKAEAAKQRLSDLNPTIEIHVYTEGLLPTNAFSVFSKYDIIVDGTDNFGSRYLINDAAVLTDKPVVYGAIYKFEGQIAVFNYQNGPTYRCLFPNPPKDDQVPNCAEVGVLGVLPGIIGSMQANEVLKIILGFNSVCSGKMLCYSAQSGETTFIELPRSETDIKKIKSNPDILSNTNYDIDCSLNNDEISFEALSDLDNIQFLDVRELQERPIIEMDNCIQIPLAQLTEESHRIDSTKKTIVFCQSGIRSLKAIEILKALKITNCKSLKHGVLVFKDQLKNTF